MRVSVPLVRRKRVIVFGLLVLVAAATTIAGRAATPIAVKASSRNEQAPAAGTDWFAWAKSRHSDTSPYDTWAQHGTDRAFKVNARNTQAYPGGIDGTTLVYQQIVGIDSSDIKLYDLAQRRRLSLPRGVNTTGWECCATLSGNWLLYTRGSPETRQLQLILLRNLVTGEQRVLDRLRNPRGVLSAGQITGNFVVWSRCNPHPACRILRYDVIAKTTTALRVPSGKVVYGPSVNSNGTTYYLRSKRGCGKSVELVKEPLTGGSEVLVAFPQGRDGDVTYAFTVSTGPPPAPPTKITRVYYDRVLCRRQTWDIYRVDDFERLPPVRLRH